MAHGALLRAVLALAALVVSFARPAHADTERAGCPASVQGWVADAGHAAGTLAYAVVCHYDSVKIRLEPADAEPLDVLVDRAPEHAFRRVGSFGVSPLLEVDDFKDVPAARREPFERFAAWVAQHPELVVFAGPGDTPIPRELHHVGVSGASLWLVVAAALLAAFARTRAKVTSVSDRLYGGALFGVALALRLVLGAWGPLRINGLGALWVMAATVDPHEAYAYGPGYAEVIGSLARHLPLAPDHAVFTVNAVLSALLPATLFALARLLGLDLRRAAFAGLLLALDPVSVRIAATESYVPLVAWLTTAASAAAAAAGYHARRRELGRAAALLVAAGLLCAQAARVHPAAWLPVALAPLAAAAVPRLSLGQRASFGLVALAVCGATVVVTSASELFGAYECMLTGETMAGTLRVPHPPALLIVGVVAAAVLLATPRAPFVLGLLSAIALASTRHNYGQAALWQASFDRFYLAPLLLGGATLIPRRAAQAVVFAPVSVVVLAALFVWKAPGTLRGRTTDHDEYQWARGWLARFPSSCRVAYVAFAGRRNLFLPTYMASPPLPAESILRLDGRQPIDARSAFGALGCLYYARTSLCSSAEGRSVCDRVERQLTLDPTDRASFPAVPSNDWLTYDRDTVESVVSRVTGYRTPRGRPANDASGR